MEKLDEPFPLAGMSEVTIREADARACDDQAASFLQTGFWGAFKAEFGWKPAHFRVGAGSASLLVLERRLARGVSFAYIPRGPVVDDATPGKTECLARLAASLKLHMASSCVFLRFDPLWYNNETVPGRVERPALDRPFRRAAVDIQPPDTTTLFLSGRSDEELLSGMKPKWRYNIRLSEKKDIKVASESGSEALDIFYSLYQTTSVRDRIALHPKRYYARLLDMAREYGPDAPDLRIWIARYEGKPLASIITSFRKREAVYLYGASSDEHRNRMPAYALQWAAIRAAREAGCDYYDFYGIPPKEEPSHAMAGLYRFKTGFGGGVLHYAGSWDYPLRPVLYSGYRAAETLRGFWFKTLRKRFSSRGGGA